MNRLLSDADIGHLCRKGIERCESERQWRFLSDKPAPVELVRPCTLEDGIEQVAEGDIAALVESHNASANAGRWSKFVPASGAASRMFALRSLDEQREFSESLQRFAFVDIAEMGRLSQLQADGRFEEVVRCVVSADGLGYRDLPKGLVCFHRYERSTRTPFEEHLLEGIACFSGIDSKLRAHFTVAPEHQPNFEQHLTRFTANRENLVVSFSVQHPSTDTIAIDVDGDLIRDQHGQPVLRPGGHGALLENLNQCQGDLIFVKNIDNVAHEHCRDAGLLWMRILGGYAAKLEKTTHQHLRSLCVGVDKHPIDAARDFVLLSFPGAALPTEGDAATLRQSLISLLRRPIRVCGMVPNDGEPGGGPFWVRQRDGSESLQVVESAEVDFSNAEQNAIAKRATHFNPVFMALAVRDEHGQPYNLHDFVDEDRAIVTEKTVNGRSARVLERPGLWNGAMARWNSVFVEVPAEVFTPVKSVLDLLRPEHQPWSADVRDAIPAETNH